LFRGSCVTVFVLLLWVLYQLRLRQVARVFTMRLEERVDERTRIARELHDTLLQNLHGLMLRFQSACNMLEKSPAEAKQTLKSAITGTERAITESQDAIQDLRSEPIARSDLSELLTMTGDELAKSGIASGSSPVFSVIVEGERRPLVSAVQIEIYRMARELLRNAFRHAEAHRIEGDIRFDHQEFRLRIRDDGKGIDLKGSENGRSPGHWGLIGIRERAQAVGARLDLWSKPGAGTEVQLTVPGAVAYERRNGSRFRIFHKESIHDQRS